MNAAQIQDETQIADCTEINLRFVLNLRRNLQPL
jgi:hypothetical protein